MINFLNLFKYHAFCLLAVVCGNALAAESDGLSEKALFDALISNLGIYFFAMVCCFTVYGIYKIKQSTLSNRSTDQQTPASYFKPPFSQ